MKKQMITATMTGALLCSTLYAPMIHAEANAQPVNTKAEISTKIATPDIKITETDLSKDTEILKVNAKKPALKGILNQELQKQIEKKLSGYYEETIANLQESAEEYAEDAKEFDWTIHPYQLHMEYELHKEGHLYSLVIKTYSYTGGANGNTIVDSINFINMPNGQLVNAEDLTSDIPSLEEKVTKQIANKEGYFHDVDIDLNRQPFYVKDGAITFLFDEYEIAAGVFGDTSITIPFQMMPMLLTKGQNELVVSDLDVSMSSFSMPKVQSGDMKAPLNRALLGKALEYYKQMSYGTIESVSYEVEQNASTITFTFFKVVDGKTVKESLSFNRETGEQAND